MRIIFLISIIFCNQALAEVRSYDRKDESNPAPEVYLRENIYSVKHIFAVNSQIQNAKILVNVNNIDFQTAFSLAYLEKGDNITIDTDQEKKFKVVIDATPKNEKFLWFKKYFNNYI